MRGHTVFAPILCAKTAASVMRLSMTEDFGRLITLLRKEKGISQKEAAAQLKVSQALLSHYEKGIRECGLNFVVRAARFYGVSTDYLLGISPNKTGAVLKMDDLPEDGAAGKENRIKGSESVLPVLNKRLIVNSLHIIFDLLSEAESRQLTAECSAYLFLAVYKVFRYLYAVDERNPDALFAADKGLFDKMADANMAVCEMKIRALCGLSKSARIKRLDSGGRLSLSQQELESRYPFLASSLMNLIQNTETKMGVRRK